MKKRTHDGFDPNAIKETGQIIRTSLLETMLRQHGFERRNQEGSHITFVHPELPIAPFTVIAGTKKIDTQIQAADKCLEAREIVRRQRQEKLETQRAASETSKTSEETGLIDTLENIPVLVIEGEEMEGVVVLRDKRLPQIGTIVSMRTHPDELDAVCTGLYDRANEQLERLGHMNRDFETSFHVEDGVLTIEHERYGLRIEVPAYDPTTDNGFDEELVRFQALVSTYDMIFRDGVGPYLDIYKRDGTTHEKPLPDGGTEWELIGAKGLTKELHRNTIQLSPQGRMEPQAFCRFVDLATDLFLSGTRTNSTTLRDHYRKVIGAEVRRPKISKKVLGDTLVITHPFIPDFERRLPAPSSIPYMAKLWEQFLGADSAIDEADLWNQLEETRETLRTLEEGFTELTDTVQKRLQSCVQQWNQNVAGPQINRDFTIEMRGNIKPSILGKVQDVVYRDKAHRTTGLRIRAMFTVTQSGEATPHIDPAQVEELKDYIRDCGYTPGT